MHNLINTFNLSAMFQLLQDKILKQVQVPCFGSPHFGDSYSGDFFHLKGKMGRGEGGILDIYI